LLVRQTHPSSRPFQRPFFPCRLSSETDLLPFRVF
jgi:hypothetical protein